MIMNFDVSKGVLIGEVVSVPTSRYFFVQNGDPRQIICHCRQSGTLTVSRGGLISLDQDREVLPPSMGDKVALIRASNEPGSRDFTRAERWVPEEDWKKFSWAINGNATRIYRAVACDHRTNGHFQSNSKQDVTIAEGTLMELVHKYPRTGNSLDHLGVRHSVKIAGHTLSSGVRWERLDGDGKLTECADPRPVL